MTSAVWTRRGLIKSATMGGAALASGALASRAKAALPKIRVMTNYFASAEQGCFFQAKATGMYEQAGLDVDVLPGNPQFNAVQMLVAGEIDVLMGKDIQVLVGLEKGVPTLGICALFQFDSTVVITRANVKSLAELRGRKIMVASSGRTTYWPWLKAKYGYSEDQMVPYTGNLQPFFADTDVAVIGVATGEPYRIRKQVPDMNEFLLAKEGYPPYGAPLVTTPAFLASHREALEVFVRTTMEAWNSYFNDPNPAFAAIKKESPSLEPDNLTFTVDVMRRTGQVASGDALTMGLGAMTAVRWEKTRDFLVRSGLLSPNTPWRQAFTTAIMEKVHVMKQF